MAEHPETWRPVAGKWGYEISTHGRVRREEDHYIMGVQRYSKSTRHAVALYHDGDRKRSAVSILAAQAFVGEEWADIDLQSHGGARLKPPMPEEEIRELEEEIWSMGGVSWRDIKSAVRMGRERLTRILGPRGWKKAPGYGGGTVGWKTVPCADCGEALGPDDLNPHRKCSECEEDSLYRRELNAYLERRKEPDYEPPGCTRTGNMVGPFSQNELMRAAG